MQLVLRAAATTAACIAAICALQLSPLPPFEINPDILLKDPVDLDSRTFADIRIGDGLVDWIPYDLDIHSHSPLESLRKQLGEGQELLVIKGPNEQDYECLLPVDSGQEEPPSLSNDSPSRLEVIQKRLESLKKTCLSLQSGYWIYEVCPFRQVRRYHQQKKPGSLTTSSIIPEGTQFLLTGALQDILQTVLGRAEQEIVTEECLLGRYVPGAENNQLVDGRLLQIYIDGDRCGDDGKEHTRQTEVRYECSLAKVVDHIIDVTEVSSCQYTVRVGSPKVCSSNAALISSKRTIRCFPKHTSLAAPIPKPEVTQEQSLSEPDKTPDEPKQPEKEAKEEAMPLLKKRLREFMAQGEQDYPLVHKILKESMEAESMTVPLSDEDLPEQRIDKWLSLLGINLDDQEAPIKPSVDSSQENDDRDEAKSPMTDSETKKKRRVVFKFRI